MWVWFSLKNGARQYVVRKFEAFRNVYNILTCCCFDWQLGMGVPALREWLGNDVDVFGVGESLPSHGREGVGQATWWRGGCWSRPALQLAQHAGDRWKGHVPPAADAILHSCPIGRGRAKIAGLAHKSSRWVCGMRSKHSHRSLSGGAHSTLWPRLIWQGPERFHTGRRWDCGPPTWAPQVFHL